MLNQLIKSLQYWCMRVEESPCAIILLYGCIGYLTVMTIATATKSLMSNDVDPIKALLIVIALFVLGLFYYARYRMIVDDKNDD